MNNNKRKIINTIFVVAINVLTISLIFFIAEIGCRVYFNGARYSLKNIIGLFSGVPYSGLGPHDWVIYDDVMGYRLNPDKEEVNSLCMREKEISIPKPQGTYRIIFLGDSLSWEQPGMVSYTAQMLDEYTNIEVLNASVPGYTTYQEMMFLKNYVIKASPDLVLLIYCLNDNHKFLHRFNSKGDMLFTKEAIKSLRINSWVDLVISKSYLLSRLKLILVGKKRLMHKDKSMPWKNMCDFNIAWKDYSWIKFEQYLKEIKRILDSEHSKLGVVIIPYPIQLKEKHLASDYKYALKPQIKLEGICKKHGLPYLDLFWPIYNRAKNGAKLYKDSLHLNENGQRLAAEEIYHFLLNYHLLADEP